MARALVKRELESLRFVVSLDENDFGGLCPRIGLEAKGVVHSDGRVDATVLIDDCAVVMPRPRPHKGAQTAAAISRACARDRHMV